MTDQTPFERCDEIANQVFDKCRALAERQGKIWPDDYPCEPCPQCGKVCTDPREIQFISDFGECLLCDHLKAEAVNADSNWRPDVYEESGL